MELSEHATQLLARRTSEGPDDVLRRVQLRQSSSCDAVRLVRTKCLLAVTKYRLSHGMKGNQHFKYRVSTKQLYHPVSNHCMDCDPERGEIFMNPCDHSSKTQKWEWQHLNAEVIEERNKKD